MDITNNNPCEFTLCGGQTCFHWMSDNCLCCDMTSDLMVFAIPLNIRQEEEISHEFLGSGVVCEFVREPAIYQIGSFEVPVHLRKEYAAPIPHTPSQPIGPRPPPFSTNPPPPSSHPPAPLSSGASQGSLQGAASLKVEKAQFAA